MSTLYLLPLLLLMHFSEPSATSSDNTSNSKTETAAISEPAKDKGYWVVQQVDGVADKVLVFYYNKRNELVKKEWRLVEDIDTSKPRVVRSLRRALHEAIKLQGEEDWN